MIIHNNIFDYKAQSESVLTIGTFDGVHIGHQKVLKKLQGHGLTRIVLTFFPHPRMVLFPNEEIKLLQSIAERSEDIAKHQVDHLIIHPFDKEFSNLSAEEFVKKILVNQLHVKKIIVGYDHKFGKGRQSNFDDLVILGQKFDFEVIKISAEEIEEQTISSTKIRNAIMAGNMSLAKSFLGHPYAITGQVIKGKSLGKTIGFATANILIKENYKLLPKNGAYVVESSINEKKYFGMLNIGHNPTTDNDGFFIEVHFFDFNQDLYDKVLKIEFIEFLREEKKFENLEALQIQLEIDKEKCLNFLKNDQSINPD